MLHNLLRVENKEECLWSLQLEYALLITLENNKVHVVSVSSVLGEIKEK